MCIIDRFEENWAVIEFKEMIFNIPKELLPPDAREGDNLKISICLDKDTTIKKQQQIKQLAEELFAD